MIRRTAALLAALALLVAPACAGSGGSNPTSKSPRASLQSLANKTKQVLSVTAAGGDLAVGRNRVVFAVLDKQGAFVPGLDLQMFFAPSADKPAQGPVRVTFEDDGLGDRAFYRAEAEFPSPGTWLLLINRKAGSEFEGAGTQIEVKAKPSAPAVGSKAISMKTPTFSDKMGLPDICSRDPEDPMHELSLDEALKNGKPTVVAIATPAFCASRVCGPIVDQVLRVRERFKDEVNFVHVEVYTDLTDSEISSKLFTEIMKTWHLESEPWTYVVDTKGVITSRFEGPVTTTELTSALEDVT